MPPSFVAALRSTRAPNAHQARIQARLDLAIWVAERPGLLRLSVLYLAYKYADSFEGAVVANTNVGGENCHRGSALGALMVRPRPSWYGLYATAPVLMVWPLCHGSGPYGVASMPRLWLLWYGLYATAPAHMVWP